jgi:inner membrane protein involved in colicin E2 resistance
MKWHMLALAMFLAPLAVTGMRFAVTRGHGQALILMTVLIVVAIAACLLGRHRRRNHRATPRPGR